MEVVCCFVIKIDSPLQLIIELRLSLKGFKPLCFFGLISLHIRWAAVGFISRKPFALFMHTVIGIG